MDDSSDFLTAIYDKFLVKCKYFNRSVPLAASRPLAATADYILIGIVRFWFGIFVLVSVKK